jgi:DNA mismatch repair protein MutL
LPGKIVVLPETLTHQIAAGEVVERPASIVKELLENALDAGATEVGVELEKGGCQSIRITDNGEGIAREDVPLAFARYATSKIGTFEEIYRVQSFGFRGEALPSIASISRVEMVTRQASSPAGTRILIEGGQVQEISDAGCPVGTSILVSRIFDPVPVRRKFLKSGTTEQGACLDAVTRLALVQGGVRIRVSASTRPLLNVPAARDLSERIALILGRDFRDQLVPVAGEGDGVKLGGFVSRPEFTRSGTAQMYLYVNGRFVKDYLLNHAVMTAYRRLIEPRRHPAVILTLDVAPGDVDVNVHPAKLEVRFRNPRGVYALIVETLSAAIGAGSPPGQVELPAGTPGMRPPAYADRIEEALKRYRVFAGPEKLRFGGPSVVPRQAPAPVPSPVREEIPPEEESPGEGGSFSNLLYLGQVAGTYLVLTGGEGLVLVDQHAAHERILFEKLRRESAGGGGKGIGQRLLLPEVVSLPPGDCAFLKESAPILEEAGLEVEPFGGDSIVVKAVPAFLSQTEARMLILDLLADCRESDRGLPLVERREKILTALACRGAVKANRRLSAPETAALCRDLDALPHAATCPHGRPIAISISRIDLEKMFKRR